MSANPASAAARVDATLHAALAAARDPTASATERADMLVEIAMGLQRRPRTPEHLHAAVALYDEALALCPAGERLAAARIGARRGTALAAVPDEGTAALERARAAFDAVLPTLREAGTPAEVAEAEMNLGLVLQQLAAAGRARMTDAIAAYQRALQTFDAKRHPAEFAVLQNNLAAAFLSGAGPGEAGGLREALAVQCFEQALKVVTLVDHPVEYAMLQNNLGNALQYAPSSHPVANNLRALAAYDEALKVRTAASTPVEYANTLANKANCLWNLPDDPDVPGAGNPRNRRLARDCYTEALRIFESRGEAHKARLVAESLAELEGQDAAA